MLRVLQPLNQMIRQVVRMLRKKLQESISMKLDILGVLMVITMFLTEVVPMMHRWRGNKKCLANSEYSVNVGDR